MLKVEGKHLIFKTSIAGIKIYLLIDNKSKFELIDEFFVHANKIPYFKLKKLINFIFKNGKVVQQFTEKNFINIIIRDYIE